MPIRKNFFNVINIKFLLYLIKKICLYCNEKNFFYVTFIFISLVSKATIVNYIFFK